MYSLVLWKHENTYTVIKSRDIDINDKRGLYYKTKYRDVQYWARIIALNDNKQWLNSLEVSTEGVIIGQTLRKCRCGRVIQSHESRSRIRDNNNHQVQNSRADNHSIDNPPWSAPAKYWLRERTMKNTYM